MKTFLAVIEDTAGNVTGASVSENGLEQTIQLPPGTVVKRAELASHARALASAFGVTLPDNPAIPPAE